MKKTGEIFSPTKMYAVTSHEVAHAAHWKFIKDDPNSSVISHFKGAKLSFVESWAVFMETQFTRHFIDRTYDKWSEYNYEYHRISNLTGYSDYFNEVFDKANYSVEQMESALVGSSSIPEWIENMKSKFNDDDATLDEIFELYTFPDE